MLGTRIKELRKEKGLTLKELGKKLNLGESTMSMYESGNRNPGFDTVIQISEIFNVSTDYLLGKTDVKNNKTLDQEEYMKSLELDTPEQAIKFILEQPSIAAFGGYDLNTMSEDEVMELADDILFAMRLSLEKKKQ